MVSAYIEIHGMSLEQAKQVEREICSFLKNRNIGFTVAVETYLATVIDREGFDKPFFRVFASVERTCSEDIEKISNITRELARISPIDIQVVYFDSYLEVPARSS